MMWILFTEGAALCMAFAAVMAKTGSKHGNYALSVAVAGTVLCVLSYFTSVKPITLHAIMKLDLNTWIFFWRWEGPLGTPLGLVHWTRASSPVEAGTAGYL